MDQSDITFSIQHAIILTILEASLAIVLACVPVLRPLFSGYATTERKPMFTTSAKRTRTEGRFTLLPEELVAASRSLATRSGPDDEMYSGPEEFKYKAGAAGMCQNPSSESYEDVELGRINVKTEITVEEKRYSQYDNKF